MHLSAERLAQIAAEAMTDKGLLAQFIRQQCTLHVHDRPETTIPKAELLDAFTAWAARNGRPVSINPATFGRYVLNLCPRVSTKRSRLTPGLHSSRAWCFTRITLNEY